MRKRFIRVAVFCALTAVAAPVFTGCSDYDDDIRSLQEQIDQVKELPHISTADMTAAINSAIETLQGQMETAIAGKADNSTVSELQQLVAELTTLANGKADASEVIALSDRINDLIEEVNGLDGTLNQKLTALQEEIGELREALASAQNQLTEAINEKADATTVNALQEQVDSLNKTLTDRLTEFDNVKEMAENNGEAIVEIQTKLTQLESLKNDISSLQEANLEHIGKFQSLDTRLEGIDEDMDKLSARIEEVASSSATAETINSIISRIQALEDYKAQTLEALVTQANADHEQLVQAIADIADLESKLSQYATLEGLQANYYDKEAIDEKFAGIETTLTDLGLLKNMIQSVVYMPNAETSYGQTSFYQLQVRNSNNLWTSVAQDTVTTVRFRVSPAKYAENFTDNYDVSFDGFKMNRAPSNFLSIRECTGDPTTGIVTMKVNTDIEAGSVYAVCLKVKPKATNEVDKNSDLTTNYFGVQHAVLRADDVKTVCDNANSGRLNYRGEQTVDYSTGRKYVGYDANGTALLGGKDLATVFPADIFSTTYDFVNPTDQTRASFSIGQTSGVLGIAEDAKGSVALIGRKVQAEANTRVGRVRTFTTQYSQITVDDIELTETLTLNATDFKNFNGLSWKDTEQRWEVSEAAYLRIFNKGEMMGDDQFFTYNMVNESNKAAYIEVDKQNKKIYLVIRGGANIDQNLSTTLTVQYGSTSTGAQRRYVITANVNAPMTYPNHTLTTDSHFWAGTDENGTVVFQPKVTRNSADQITGVDFSMNLESVFTGYTDDVTAIDNVGGEVTNNWRIANPTGTTVSGHTLTIDQNTYNNGALNMSTAITYGQHTTHRYAANIVVEGFSGTWVAGEKTIYVSDRNEANIETSKGFQWNDMFGNPMWKDGVAWFGNNLPGGNVYDYATGTNPFTLWGLTKPTYELVNADDAKYVTLDPNTGVINFTEDGKTWQLVENLVIRIRIKAESPWGTIADFANNDIITIIVPAAQ